jgi:TadE-like protein
VIPRAALRRTRHRGSGQALVEFALVFPIFLLILFGIIDVGRLVFTNSALSQASREGARAAATEAAWIGLSDPGCVASLAAVGAGNPGAHVCPSNVAAFKADVLLAANRMNAGLGPISTVYVSCNSGGPDPAPTGEWTETSGGNGCQSGGSPNASAGYLVSVRVVYEYQPLTPVISSLIGPLTLSGSATMVIN